MLLPAVGEDAQLDDSLDDYLSAIRPTARDIVAMPDKAIYVAVNIALGEDLPMESLDEEVVGAVHGSGNGWCSGDGTHEACIRAGAAEAEVGQVDGAIVAAGN